MNHIDKIKEMLELQDNFNKEVIGENWKDANTSWYRAIWLEYAELLESTSWKWWQNKPTNINHVTLELTDVLHFGLSDLLKNNKNISTEELAVTIYSKFKSIKDLDRTSTIALVQNVVEDSVWSTIQLKKFNLELFFVIAVALKLNIDNLHCLYIGKNVLNKFRQDNGYKEHEYKKEWSSGKEDNDYLLEIIYSIDYKQDNIKELIYEKLKHTYKEVKTT